MIEDASGMSAHVKVFVLAGAVVAGVVVVGALVVVVGALVVVVAGAAVVVVVPGAAVVVVVPAPVVVVTGVSYEMVVDESKLYPGPV
jgi:hypothetical protein